MIKLWRNLKNLSQKQLAFVKENCSTGLRWTSVGEAWDADLCSCSLANMLEEDF